MPVVSKRTAPNDNHELPIRHEKRPNRHELYTNSLICDKVIITINIFRDGSVRLIAKQKSGIRRIRYEEHKNGNIMCMYQYDIGIYYACVGLCGR